MSKHLEAVLKGMRQSLHFAPRRSYIDPNGQRTASDAQKLREDGLTVVRNMDKVFRLHDEPFKNR